MRVSITVHPDNFEPLLDFIRTLPDLNVITILAGRDLTNYTPTEYQGVFISIETSNIVQRFDNKIFAQIAKIVSNPLFKTVSKSLF